MQLYIVLIQGTGTTCKDQSPTYSFISVEEFLMFENEP
jgi:hypothetical protein